MPQSVRSSPASAAVGGSLAAALGVLAAAPPTSAAPAADAATCTGALGGAGRHGEFDGSRGGTLSGTSEARRGTAANGPSPIDFASEYGRAKAGTTGCLPGTPGASGTGGSGAGLALTGAGTAVPPAIGGAAVPAAGAGAGMVLVARRRRA